MKKEKKEEETCSGGIFIPVRIHQDLCKGCGLCVTACPKNLIRICMIEVNRKGYHPARFEDPKGECLYCAQCAVMCPDVAIEIFRQTKE